MLSEKYIRKALDTFKEVAVKAYKDNDMQTSALFAAGLLGWVLEDGVYVENTEVILRELRKLLSNMSG